MIHHLKRMEVTPLTNGLLRQPLPFSERFTLRRAGRTSKEYKHPPGFTLGTVFRAAKAKCMNLHPQATHKRFGCFKQMLSSIMFKGSFRVREPRKYVVRLGSFRPNLLLDPMNCELEVKLQARVFNKTSVHEPMCLCRSC